MHEQGVHGRPASCVQAQQYRASARCKGNRPWVHAQVTHALDGVAVAEWLLQLTEKAPPSPRQLLGTHAPGPRIAE